MEGVSPSRCRAADLAGKGLDDRMGIYDRDYYRDEQEGGGFHFRGPRTVVAGLLLVNIGIWLVGQLFFHHNPQEGLDRLSQRHGRPAR